MQKVGFYKLPIFIIHFTKYYKKFILSRGSLKKIMTNVQKAFAKVVSESGLNVVQISQLSGIKQQTLSHIKTGRRQITLKVIIKMCDALETSYDELITALVMDIKSAGTL